MNWQISELVGSEASLFLKAVQLGMEIVFLYDLLRIFRRVVLHNVAGEIVEDLLYWIYVAVVVFVQLYDKNDGRLRAYVFGSILTGMVIYAGSFGRICVPHIIRLLRRVLGILFGPVRRAAAYLDAKQKKGQEICGKVWICQKKRLKKLWKMVKMSLCKL